MHIIVLIRAILETRAEILKIFSFIFGRIEAEKNASEITWIFIWNFGFKNNFKPLWGAREAGHYYEIVSGRLTLDHGDLFFTWKSR